MLVTIEGSLPGADYATLNFYMQGCIKQYADETGKATGAALKKQQQRMQRITLGDL